jgi:hypothetical protein
MDSETWTTSGVIQSNIPRVNSANSGTVGGLWLHAGAQRHHEQRLGLGQPVAVHNTVITTGDCLEDVLRQWFDRR